ncbi:MAG: hypothetical protein FWG77_02220 [Treponema sp.]|nr:hypothetical protein [Treponema sp.]
MGNALERDRMIHAGIVDTIESTVLSGTMCQKLWQNMWLDPIIKIIPAGNEKIGDFKKHVSPSHLMPEDILPGAKSIISYFIPFHESIPNSNIEGENASIEWAGAYVKTNKLITIIADNIEAFMGEHGYKSGKLPATHNYNKEDLISNWSHRHIAYLAGIGTFGRNNMFITESGCCGRLGSIIIDYEFSEYEQVEEPRERCISKSGKTCDICISRCMVGAYSAGAGGNYTFDRHKCHEQCLKNGELYEKLGAADVCGKCVVGLPCSTGEPARATK